MPLSPLDSLLARQSCDYLLLPLPSPEVLGKILSAALRAPDHGRLRPWRLAVFTGHAREELAEKIYQASLSGVPPTPESKAARRRKRFLKAPGIIALGGIIHPQGRISVKDQECAIAAAGMNILNALHFAGFGSIWLSGAYCDVPSVLEAVYPEKTEGIFWLAGFILFGTPGPELPGLGPKKRPDVSDHVRFYPDFSFGKA